jgi:hypothetical protein
VTAAEMRPRMPLQLRLMRLLLLTLRRSIRLPRPKLCRLWMPFISGRALGSSTRVCDLSQVSRFYGCNESVRTSALGPVPVWPNWGQVKYRRALRLSTRVCDLSPVSRSFPSEPRRRKIFRHIGHGCARRHRSTVATRQLEKNRVRARRRRYPTTRNRGRWNEAVKEAGKQPEGDNPREEDEIAARLPTSEMKILSMQRPDIAPVAVATR